MTLNRPLKLLGAATMACGLALSSASSVHAQDSHKVRWKMHSAFPSSLLVLGTGGKRVEANVSKASNGTLELTFFEPNALVPAYNYFDAVSQGSVKVAWGIASIQAGKVPALSFFGAVPFGPDPAEYLAWLKYGGGQDLYDEIYAQFNVKPILCGMIPPEAGGWFRKEIESAKDLQGLKMRIGSYGAKVYEKLGASSQLIAAGDTFLALELGTVDAIEFSMPAIDEQFGFYQVAKHYYFPGWHQQATLMELAVNMDAYQGLADYHKAILDMVCGNNVMENLAEGEALQAEAIERMQEKGAIVHRFSDELLQTFEAAWKEVIAEEAASDPQVKQVWDSYSSFRQKYAIWRELGYLE